MQNKLGVVCLLSGLLSSVSYAGGVDAMPVVRGQLPAANVMRVTSKVQTAKIAKRSQSVASSGISVTLYPGSMKANLTRLAHYFGWHTVVWQPSVDFNWVGTTKIHADNFQDLLAQVLAQYPLQAQFYQGNHVLVVTTRTLK